MLYIEKTPTSRLLRMVFLTLILTCATFIPALTRAQPSIHFEGDEIFAYFMDSRVLENRGRLHLKFTYSPVEWLLFKASGYGEYLYRDISEESVTSNFRAHESYIELRGSSVDVRAGFSNIIWGVLDEIQPNDVINPLDASRFFLDGRKAARLPVPLISTRIYFPSDLRVEVVVLPFFEKGVFDQLEEETSPFNIFTRLIPAGFSTREDLPEKSLREMEYGGRLSWTLKRVDLDFYAFRGREDFPVYAFQPAADMTFVPVLTGHFPGFTSLGGDMETVIGRWGVRGEGSVVLDDSFQHPLGLEVVRGKSIQAGIGLDRKIDEHLFNANLVFQKRWAESDFFESPEELNLVAAYERSTRYELQRMKLFFICNPIDNTYFVRWNGGINLFQDFWLELSTGIFIGSGNDLIGRFEDSDFVFLKGRYYY